MRIFVKTAGYERYIMETYEVPDAAVFPERRKP